MPLHPQIVHFPIALLSIAVLSELISYFWQKDFFSKMAFYLLIIGVITTFFAVKTGESSLDLIDNINSIKPLLSQHQQAGEWVLKIFSIVLIIKSLCIYFKKKNLFIKIFVTLLMLVGLFQVYQAGHFGGILVYEKGVGIQKFDKTNLP